MGAQKKAYVNTRVELDLGSGAPNVDGFLHCTTPKGTLNVPKLKAWNAQEQAENVITSSTVEWSDIVATKLHDDASFKTLWNAFKDAIKDPAAAKKDMKLVEKSNDANGTALATWTLKGALIKGVETSDMDANGHEVKKLTVHVTFDDADVV